MIYNFMSHILDKIKYLSERYALKDPLKDTEMLVQLGQLKSMVEELDADTEADTMLIEDLKNEIIALKLQLGWKAITKCCGAEAGRIKGHDYADYWYCPKCYEKIREDGSMPETCEIEWKEPEKDECEHKWVKSIDFENRKRVNTENAIDEEEITQTFKCEKCGKEKTEVWTEYSLV